MSNRTTLATIALQHTDDRGALVDSPVTVVATDNGPGTRPSFTVERHGEPMTHGGPTFRLGCRLNEGDRAGEPAVFDEAAAAMAFALEACGWLHAVTPFAGQFSVA